MPAIKLVCEGCSKVFWAARRDTKYHTQKCRYLIRRESSRFETPKIPKSGVKGVTFNRINCRWSVKIPEERHWKYVGSFALLEKAIKFQKDILEQS